MTALEALSEFYEDSNAPHEALARSARKLSVGGALYLGGGIGVEKERGAEGKEVYRVTDATAGGKGEAFTGPLSAAMRGFAKAGGSTAIDTPGGATKVTDPAAAARLRELADEESSAKQRIDRYERQIARRAGEAAAVTPWSPGTVSDDDWRAREVAELKATLKSIAAERAKLLSAGEPVSEAESGKPGTNWTQVTPANRKKVSPLVRHYMKSAHPFTECVRDNRKRFGADAEKVCAVVKDMGEKTTKWRKGSKVAEVASASVLAAAVDLAEQRLAAIDAELGAGMAVELAARAGEFGEPTLDALGEGAFADLGTLFVGGHPLGVLWQEMREAFSGGSSTDPARTARTNLRRQGRTPGSAAKTPSSSGSWDETKHKRGAAGSSQGGKFVTTGSSGSEVRSVQRRVGAKTDGAFGPKTKQAVKNFQRQHRLVVDGVVGHQTALALQGKFSKARAASTGALRDTDRERLGGKSTTKTRTKPKQATRSNGGWTIG